MARKHQAAIKADKSVKEQRFVLDNCLPSDDCEEEAEVAKDRQEPYLDLEWEPTLITCSDFDQSKHEAFWRYV
ncbi:hypothetical protein E4U19_001927 [Claviceps sp. Clav32 group G5]|nr:hypothetical protein E4U19_001927 [Claviceps sp. Clav32 group G5]KAG6047532.1 hypothetical protein E4U39_000332 [Claviceps sp. Clav50 group G5]